MMLLGKNSVCAESQVLGDVNVLAAKGPNQVLRDVVRVLGAELAFPSGRGRGVFHAVSARAKCCDT